MTSTTGQGNEVRRHLAGNNVGVEVPWVHYQWVRIPQKVSPGWQWGQEGKAGRPTLNSLSMGSLLCRMWDKSRRR